MTESKSSYSKSFPPSWKVIISVFFLYFVGNSLLEGQRFHPDIASETASKSFRPGGPDGKSLFYIYEWPSYLDDLWPPPNATLHAKSGYDHGFYDNRGAGTGIAPDVGLFQTWQFSLYKNLMARLRTSEFRTRDPSKATAFIIPFDLGKIQHLAMYGLLLNHLLTCWELCTYVLQHSISYVLIRHSELLNSEI